MTKPMTNQNFSVTDVTSILAEVLEIDRHWHNRERVISNGGVNLTPFTAISGNNAYGAEVAILAAGDTPIQAGMTYFDLGRMFVARVGHTSPYRMQVVYGTGTFADALAAGQYTEIIYKTDNVNQRSTVWNDFRFPHVPSGTKVWWRIWNATNLSEVDAFFDLHEYPA
jgi:hypothetical protein